MPPNSKFARPAEMRTQPGIITFGIIFILLGLAGLIHPRVILPPKRQDVSTPMHRYIIETRRVVTVPTPVGVVLIVAGAALVFLGSRKIPAQPSRARR